MFVLDNYLTSFKHKCISIFLKNKPKGLIQKYIYKKYGLIDKKTQIFISDFLSNMNQDETEVYNQLINNKHINSDRFKMESYTDILFHHVENFLLKNNEEKLTKNKESIFKLIDLLEHNSPQQQKLIQLYLNKIHSKETKGEYQNLKLNQLSKISNNKIKSQIIKHI